MKKEDEELFNNIKLVSEYMGIKYVTPMTTKSGEYLGAYQADDEDGTMDHSEETNWYEPHKKWDTLMPVCKKIIESYFAEREEIFAGLHDIDIKRTFNGVVEFIKFWNDDSKEKMTWSNI